MLVLAGAALLAAPAQNAQTPPGSSGAIRGIVVRAGTAEALAKAVVDLRGDDDRLPAIGSTTTETDGRFLFPNVRPGTYRLIVTRPGDVSRPIDVTVSGGRTEDLAVAMTATGAIAGRVYGQNGEPLGNVEVSALKSSYQNGHRVLTAVQSVRTNDRGEYRLFWLSPGRYAVRATHPDAEAGPMAMIGPPRIGGGYRFQIMAGGGLGPNGVFEIRSTGDPVLADTFGVGIDTPAERFLPVYFPGTTDDQTATAIDLRAGADIGAIDVPVAPVRARHVRGVVINGATGQVAQYAGLSEVQAGIPPGRSIGGPDSGRLSNNGLNPIDPDGSFDVTLLPGRHTLMGTAGTGVGFVSLEVRDADLDGARIVAVPAFNITGRIVTDAPVERPDLTNVRISLWRDLGVPTPSSSYSLPRADGTFVVSAGPGDYQVSLLPFLSVAPGTSEFVVPVPKGFEQAYVKSIRLGDVDVLNARLRLEGATASALEIVLGMNPGAVEGTVVNGTQANAAGATVALLPNVRGRFDLVRTATADASGRFRMDHVAPGQYKLFGWNEVVDGDWLDPDFTGASENRGVPIQVEDAMTSRVRLALAP
ncbi:MAG: carboxypeptidase-like regulatory domain-containing protein [Acidobacteriota bacterium]